MSRRNTLFGEFQRYGAPPNMFMGMLLAVLLPIILIFVIRILSKSTSTQTVATNQTLPMPKRRIHYHGCKISSNETSTGTDTLRSNQFLNRNESIISENGQYHAVMQDDGNFVIYDGPRARGKPTWATGTDGKGGTQIIMQDDGNLVIYRGARANKQVKWASDTDGQIGSRLVMQDDGKLVMYSGIDGKAVWGRPE